MRSLPVGDVDGVQLQIAVRSSGGGYVHIPGEPLVVVNVRRAAWLDGCRYLAASGVLPIAEMAFPSAELPEDADPGKLADAYARKAVELAMQGRVIEAPENHALWGNLRRFTGEGFMVGWFAARRGTSGVLDCVRELKRIRTTSNSRPLERSAMDALFDALARFER